MKILVTGGGGYIGAVLVPALLEQGYEVTVVDKFMRNELSLLGYCYNPRLRIFMGDVRDRELMGKLVEDADFILPLAAIVGAPLCDRDPIAARTTNLEAIRMLLELSAWFVPEATRAKQKIIFPCSNSGYGIGQEGIYCTEETTLRPISLYGRLKVEAERVLMASENCISLRLATVFGASPSMRLDTLVNNFVYRAVTDNSIVLYQSHFKRNYIHVRDVAKAFVHCIKNWDGMKNQVYNLGLSDANISKLELCREIKKQFPNFYFVEAEVGEDPDKRNYIVSNAKIEAAGFRADFSLQMGIAELITACTMVQRRETP